MLLLGRYMINGKLSPENKVPQKVVPYVDVLEFDVHTAYCVPSASHLRISFPAEGPTVPQQ